MVDISPKDRLVLKRNGNLQKQLDFTLQILNEEYRQTKERMYKDERECGMFLQTLYSTVPGLHCYGQPDTRAMNSNSMLKERRFSIISFLSGDDDDDDDDSRPHRPFSRDSTLTRTFAGSAPSQARSGTPESRPRSGKQDGRSSTPAEGRPRSGKQEGGGRRMSCAAPAPGTRPWSGKQEGFGASSRPYAAAEPPGGRDGLGGRLGSAKGEGRNRSRPGALRSGAAGGRVGRGGRPQSAMTGHSRPSTAFSQQSRTQPPQYGSDAYTEHDLSVRDKVIDKFKVIFDPETLARKVNLSTMATPLVVVDPDFEDTDDNMTTTTGSALLDQNNVDVIRVNGEQFNISTKPSGPRRVVWSAQPSRRVRTVSAPNSARPERPSSEAPPISHPASSIGRSATFSAARPASSSARPKSSKLHSSSLSSMNGKAKSGAWTHMGSSDTRTVPVTLDPKVQALALQRSLPVHYLGRASPLSNVSSRDEEDSEDSDDQMQSPSVNATKPDSNTSQRKQQRKKVSDDAIVLGRVKSPAATLNHSVPRENCQDTHETKRAHAKTSNSSQPQLKGNERTRKTSVLKTSGQSADAQSHPSNQLRIPGKQHPYNNHNDQRNDTASEGDSSSTRWSVVKNAVRRPKSHQSETSDIEIVTPPVALMAKLMRAGHPVGSSSAGAKRPKTAPSKSELSHRSMPAPRQTVAGILAQIENQKANTRHMLRESKQLQKMIKNLVPWEQGLDD
ncbi:treacle protein-like [Littorina saxatilis]|uniref:Uncharacterized protein n=1 Tax=Littorina saxatilis TaxID=31220 RepID=A0AAN9BEZ6_9CAEN